MARYSFCDTANSARGSGGAPVERPRAWRVCMRHADELWLGPEASI